MNKPVIVLGAGGHAKVIVEALRRSSITIIGLTDILPEKKGASLSGAPVIGDDSAVLGYSPEDVLLANGIGSIGLPEERRRIFEGFKEKGYMFASVLHPSAVVSSDVLVSEGAQVMAGAVIQPGCVIGRNAIINTSASIDHDAVIGDHVHIAPGATISGAVRVGSGTHIGAGATVIQGITIGSGCVVGAGSLVIRDVAGNSTVMGAPAKEVRR